MSQLNSQQQRIVSHLEGAALVIAGAGSGKTRVITHRAANLIKQGVPPGAILMVTFTNKAAEEMKRRIQDMAGGEANTRGLMAGTFHSMANRFLRRYGNLIGYDNNFTILDDTDSRDLFKAVIADMVPERQQSNGRKFPTAAVVQGVVSMGFNRGLELGELLERDYPWLIEWMPELEAVAAAYRARKKTSNSMDFDDLLDNWCHLLATCKNLEMAEKLRFVMVDEYQDTNLIQAEILALLAAKHGNIMAVGDDAQSIYGWRGANFRNILDFPERFGGQVFRLEQNYRSSPEILNLANHSINHNTEQFEKRLEAIRPAAGLPGMACLRDEYEEADYVLEKIMEFRDRDIPLSQMGVLYRNHAQSAVLQMRLSERGIPFQVRSGIKFFEQAHIKDVVSFLKVLFNPLDEIAWLRILKMLPGVGNVTARKIYGIFSRQRGVRLAPDNDELNKAVPAKAREQWKEFSLTMKALLADGVGPAEMISMVARGFYHTHLYSAFDNAPERANELEYLSEFASRYGSVERFLSQLALVGAAVIREYEEEQEDDPEFLILTSIHQAKGLEWDAVFLIGLADGRLPHARNLEPLPRLEEERRLFYVAVTRCKRFLELTVPLVSYTQGRAEICRPSRFVEELPTGALEVRQGSREAESLTPLLGQGPGLSVEW
ncbi:MAG: ATP-dependent helicase [Deltaproteobacteria bacterium]|nr:ATP-dependent helicase [Deltaproteobacteria bacterium]